jgi:hypothetical protein
VNYRATIRRESRLNRAGVKLLNDTRIVMGGLGRQGCAGMMFRSMFDFLARLFCLVLGSPAVFAAGHTLSISGTRFYLNDQPFPYTAVSFFNAIYNPTFNQNSAARKEWIAKFQKYGINVLRVWCQWDNQRTFVDLGPDKTLYHPDGGLREEHVKTLKAIIADADELGVIVQVVLFSHESWANNIRLAPTAMDQAVAAVTRELMPHRNVVFQVWNEFSERVIESVRIIRSVDAKRLVTNSAGFSSFLGDPPQNNALDYLTPHTMRQTGGRHWEIAPVEIQYLLTRYRKPVVDDEPARNGTPNFGGPKQATSPYDHILQIQKVWQIGGYICYHHDMFQTGYGTPACPPQGIPDPEFNPYHRQVFEFIALRDRYMQPGTFPAK